MVGIPLSIFFIFMISPIWSILSCKDGSSMTHPLCLSNYLVLFTYWNPFRDVSTKKYLQHPCPKASNEFLWNENCKRYIQRNCWYVQGKVSYPSSFMVAISFAHIDMFQNIHFYYKIPCYNFFICFGFDVFIYPEIRNLSLILISTLMIK